MSHTVARYLARLSYSEYDVLEFYERLVPDGADELSDWQIAWLMEPLLTTKFVLPDRVATWTRSLALSSGSALVRSRAALAVALDGKITPTEIGSLFDRSSRAAQPELVLAMMYVDDSTNQHYVQAVSRGNAYLLALVEFVEQNSNNA
jgi:hypothetical protein